MSTTENILFLLFGAHSASIIWLCFERDRMANKIKELESK